MYNLYLHTKYFSGSRKNRAYLYNMRNTNNVANNFFKGSHLQQHSHQALLASFFSVSFCVHLQKKNVARRRYHCAANSTNQHNVKLCVSILRKKRTKFVLVVVMFVCVCECVSHFFSFACRHILEIFIKLTRIAFLWFPWLEEHLFGSFHTQIKKYARKLRTREVC